MNLQSELEATVLLKENSNKHFLMWCSQNLFLSEGKWDVWFLSRTPSWTTNPEAGIWDTFCATGEQIFQKSRSHLQILIARRVAWRKFHSEHPHSEWPVNLMVMWHSAWCMWNDRHFDMHEKKKHSNNHAENITCHGTKYHVPWYKI
jgi:hypothetical protein